MLTHIFIAVEDIKIQRLLIKILKQSDIVLDNFDGQTFQIERIFKQSYDIIVLSKTLIPSPVSSNIKLIKQLPDSPDIIILSENENPEERAKLLAAGSDIVLFSGLSSKRFQEVFSTILKKQRDRAQKYHVSRQDLSQPRLSDFGSTSPAMVTFMNMVSRVVKSDVSLLILGETGVGKERLARAIHAESKRSKGPFIAVNCGAFPESLLESELFGHEEGAFTGATRARRGWFEIAHGGTIFLDEIGDLPNHLQVKLLRVLQDKEIQRVGSEKTFKVDVRVMAASNRNLETEVEAKRFRRDLYYRLCVVTLTIPPLRERIEDIPFLVTNYISYIGNRMGSCIYEIEEKAMESLCQYSWPGNVRELINVLERAILLCGGELITSKDLPEVFSQKLNKNNSFDFSLGNFHTLNYIPDDWFQKPYHELRRTIIDSFEKTYLMKLLQSNKGRVGETAFKMGIRPRSLFEKMRRYGLRKEDFKNFQDLSKMEN